MKLSIVIPVRNEVATVATLIERVREVVAAARGVPVSAFSLADLEQFATDGTLTLRALLEDLRAAGLELVAEAPIDRLSDASAATLQEQWTRIEGQLDEARAFLSRHDDRRQKRAVYDPSFAWLQRTLRELDQYARAVRWVMTVEDGR